MNVYVDKNVFASKDLNAHYHNMYSDSGRNVSQLGFCY